MKPSYATTEVYVNKAWVQTNYPSLKKDDIFRMYKDGAVSTDGKGNSVFKALADAATTNGFDYNVECEPYTIKES